MNEMSIMKYLNEETSMEKPQYAAGYQSHPTMTGFTNFLSNVKPERVHVFYTKGLFGFGVNATIRFGFAELESEKPLVHVFKELEPKKFAGNYSALRKVTTEKEIAEVEGCVRADKKTGYIIHKFLTNEFGDVTKIEESYQHWLNAATNDLNQSLKVNYLRKGDDGLYVDATTGQNHTITILHPETDIAKLVDEFSEKRSKDSAKLFCELKENETAGTELLRLIGFYGN